MSRIAVSRYSEYDVNYIGGCMSLRTPQKQSLKILDAILDEVALNKEQDLGKALDTVHGLFPTCTDFERDFISLSFALATGVGKTRLMGAFITYLYTVKGIKNFFVVAPNLTIYDKLSRELTDTNHSKYVFRCVGCFAGVQPHIVTGDNYKQAGYTYGASDCTINIFNIAKFNKELGNIKKLSEYLGESYFNYLSSQEDLVVIMDESHHYRADKGFAAINDLKPVLGLELTATPQTEQGGKTVKFKNVVYEYPLSRAIRDGYTKMPFAMTRRDIADLKFSDDDMDKMMLTDGLLNHERVKAHLDVYAKNNAVPPVKPFALVVCKDTAHAEKVLRFIESDSFEDGKYKNKTVILHSAQKGSEKEENIRQLLEIEKYENPVEIVIHVNILKEGWDVNNLYTIIPLRTAASKTLREQTVGRGLRLPYGKRTDDKVVDALVITAHDKFDEIVREANDPNSLLRAGNIIFAEDIDKAKPVTVPSVAQARIMEVFTDIANSGQYSQEQKEVLASAVRSVGGAVAQAYRNFGGGIVNERIIEDVLKTKDLADIVRERTDFSDILRRFTGAEVKRQREILDTATMAIPQIKVYEDGKADYHFEPFVLDVSNMNYAPINNDIQLQNLMSQEIEIIRSSGLSFQAVDPMAMIATELKNKPEVGDDCTDLLFDLITAFLSHLKQRFTNKEIQNIVMFYKKDITDKIYGQMKEHFVSDALTLIEKVCEVSNYICDHNYTVKDDMPTKTLYEPVDAKDLPNTLFYGFKKALHLQYKFDSTPEKTFAIVCEGDPTIKKWLRPAPQQFKLLYDGGKRYEPDFVVETAEFMYLVEIKGEDKLKNPDVISKRARAVRYCEVVNVYADAHKLKYWKHLFIPSKEVTTTSSFENLVKRFEVRAK